MKNPVNDMTSRWLEEAGVGPGMRVVDIGCGPGFVTFEVARRVGAAGRVYGVDRDPTMLQLAEYEYRKLELGNVQFLEAGFNLSVPDGELVDAAVGRRVLMYQANPVRAVQQLVRVVRPGGLVLFHEHDTVTVKGPGKGLPLHDEVRGWFWNMLRGEGARLNMGFELHSVLSAAGLEVEQVRAEANVLTPTSEYPVGAIVRAVIPRLERLGIVSESEADPETLDQRLFEERRRTGTTCVWELVFCAWARVPI